MSGEASQSIETKVLWGGGRSPFSISYGKMMMWFFLISDALTFGGLLTSLGFYKHKYGDLWPVSEDVFNAFPFLGEGYPLMYVALMTFILIISSVTMVLAVEAGHRMDKKGVILWLALTVVGGFFFVGSQAWEWYHYIHGSEHGAYVVNNDVRLSDGRVVGATTVVHVAKVEDGHLHFFKELEEAGESGGVKLPYRPAPGEDPVLVRGEDAHKLLAASTHIHGANLSRNEYGHPLYADFFFFVTGFHGFHVFSGVVINIIILIGVVLGTYHKRGHYEMVEKVGLYWHFVDLVWVFVFTFYYLL